MSSGGPAKRERSEPDLPASAVKRQKDSTSEFPPLPPFLAAGQGFSSTGASSSSAPAPPPPLPAAFTASPALKTTPSPGHWSPGTPSSLSLLPPQLAAWDQLAKRWFECVLLLRCHVELELKDAAGFSATTLPLQLLRLGRWGAVYQHDCRSPIRLAPPSFAYRLTVSPSGVLSPSHLHPDEAKRPVQTVFFDTPSSSSSSSSSSSFCDKLGRTQFRFNDEGALVQITVCVSANVITPFAFSSSYFATPMPARPAPEPFGFVPLLHVLQKNQTFATSAAFNQLGPQDTARIAHDQRDSEFLAIFGNYSVGISVGAVDQSVCLFEKMFHEQCVTHVVSQYLPTLGVELSGFPLACARPWSPAQTLVADVVVFRSDASLIWATTSFLHLTPHPVLGWLYTLSFIPEDDRSCFELVVSLRGALPTICAARIIFSPTKASKFTRSHSKLLDISLSAMKVRAVQHRDW